MEIGGNHKQEIYSGKNILNFGASKSGTINGITYSYDENTQIWTVNGTATAKTDVHFGSIIKSKANKVYQLETFHLGGSISSDKCMIYMQDENQNWAGWSCQLLNVDARQPATKDKNLSMGLLIFRIESGITLNNYKFKAQFEQTDNPTVVEWEPYVGGIPSPNPNYPSEIKTVGSNVNLLDISKLEARTSYGITFESTNTGIKISGTAEDTYAYGRSIKFELKKGKTCTLYGKNAGNTFKLELKKAGTIVMTIKTSEDKVTFTPNEDIDSITFVLEGITKGKTYNYEISNIKLEEGSTPTSYSGFLK